MTPEEAEQTIIRHAEPVDPPGGRSFLGNLRPYQGVLYESNFFEVIEAIRTLAPICQEADKVNRKVIAALWDICWLGRCWGIHPDGMLQRNRLVTAEDTEILGDWMDRLSEAVSYMLNGGNVDDAMIAYTPLAQRRT